MLECKLHNASVTYEANVDKLKEDMVRGIYGDMVVRIDRMMIVMILMVMMRMMTLMMMMMMITTIDIVAMIMGIMMTNVYAASQDSRATCLFASGKNRTGRNSSHCIW